MVPANELHLAKMQLLRTSLWVGTAVYSLSYELSTYF